jgi:peptidyl-prolyl cis-trans isomerase D
MELGTIDWWPDNGDGIGAYEDFRAAAAEVTTDDFPEILSLSDGSIFAIRMDELLPERDHPFEDARDAVQGIWESERAERLLTEQAEALLPQLESGGDFAELGLRPQVEEGLIRGAFLSGTPRDFMEQVFEMEPGDVRLIAGFGAVNVVRLDEVLPASENPQAEAALAQISNELNASLASDLAAIFASDTLMRAGSNVDQRALQAVHANFQ